MIRLLSPQLFHTLLFLYVFLSMGLYFWMAFRNKEKLCRTVFVTFSVLVVAGALVLWLDINIKNIQGLFEASFSPEKGISVSYAPTIDDIASTVDDSRAEVIDKIVDKEVKLHAQPLELVFYKPDKPEVEGQVKAKITALVKNKGNEIAKNVKFEFVVDDGTGRIVSSREWNRIVGYKEQVFNIYPNNVVILSWTPDMPSRQFYVDNRQKNIKITIKLQWESSGKRIYKLENISLVRYDGEKDNFYFDILKIFFQAPTIPDNPPFED